jgi:hypothetical protein
MKVRLVAILETLPYEMQNGFRPGRGCFDGTHNVRFVLRKLKEHRGWGAPSVFGRMTCCSRPSRPLLTWRAAPRPSGCRGLLLGVASRDICECTGGQAAQAAQGVGI